MKTSVINSKDYTVYTEYVQGYVFIHMDVFKWNKTIRQSFLKDWTTWASEQSQPIFAMPFIDDTKMFKWVSMCGFKLFKLHPCTDCVTRKLYIWSN